MSGTDVAPGWHPDPTGGHAMRFWDGQHWTDHVSDPASNPVQTDSASLTTLDANNDWHWSPTSAVLAILAVLVFCGVGAMFLYNRRHTPTPLAATPSAFADTSPTTPSVVTDSPTTTPWFPPGYYEGTGTSSDFAYKFSEPSAFQCHGTNYLLTPVPCWQLVVITRLGCPTGVDVTMNVDATGDTVIGQASGSLNVDLAPGGRAIVQVQASQTFPAGITGSAPDISCAL